MEEVLKNESEVKKNEGIKRPWQGNALVGMQIFASILTFLALIINILVDFIEYKISFGEFIIFVGFFGLILIPSITIFLVRAFLKGNKVIITIMMVLYVTSFLKGLPSLVDPIMFIPLILQGFMVYLSYFCFKHPFYNQKKVK